MRHWRWYSKLLFALLVAAFAYAVWPTPWQVYTLGATPIRVHRFTGRAERLTADGWRSKPRRSRLQELLDEGVNRQGQGQTFGDLAREQRGK